jgi:hypothetical protein
VTKHEPDQPVPSHPQLLTLQMWPVITAFVSYPNWGGLAWVMGARHTGQVYELLLLRAFGSQPEARK